MTGIDRIIVSSDDKVTAGKENFIVEVSVLLTQVISAESWYI